MQRRQSGRSSTPSEVMQRRAWELSGKRYVVAVAAWIVAVGDDCDRGYLHSGVW